ncbi:hypothetical protein OG413_33875 [Streptomyces sp. NBC_01433]|uniref:hypothetical protein n=1 Tax=Streptomyces sp. NBC_01433 TaxID=2903864 RepID=UPI00225B98E5|nr:hypothetical protein [Streptomyces sp. NBC_01433]MCX4680205.1 hypothetical protein [Streptomyces sp. NBC_01433]
MTPFPEPGRGSTHRRGRPDAAARRARHALAALLLAVLTLVGGAPAAAGAAIPVRALTGPAPVAAYAPVAPAPAPAQHTDRTVRTGQIHDTRRFRTGATGGHDTRTVTSGQDTRRGRTVVATGHDHPRAAATSAPHPRAGITRAQAPNHSPPPAHSALPPRTPVLPAPRTLTQCRSEAASRVPDGSPAGLPVVRGPPGTTAGPSTGHRSCPTDLPSRPR